MMTKKEIYRQAFRELEKRRLNSKKRYKYNLKTVYATCPEIEQLKQKSSQNLLKLIKLTLNSKKEINDDDDKLRAIAEIESENAAINNKIKTLLKIHNISEDVFNLKPQCELCNDYGVKNYQHCRCLENIVKKITISEFQKSFNTKLTNFETFNLNFYSKTKKSFNENVSDYDKMSAIFNLCKNFAKNFPNVSYGFIMQGSTGVGKTHLSMAIASELISKNFTVIYAKAPELVRKIAEYQFNKVKNNELNILDLAVQNDLLIIDDLGTEFESKINQTLMFEILDKRFTFQKPIILNTNLKPDVLAQRYDARIFSRIYSNLTELVFVGTDNRYKINNPPI